MGYRLSGPVIEHAKGFNIVSDGIVTGSVQVPGSGEPIVLLADRQTTGGYPKIATIVSADLPRFVQQRPGSAMRFAAVTLAEAIAAAREQAAMLEAVRAGLKPVGLGLDTEHLLSVNLVDGWVDAMRPSSIRPGHRRLKEGAMTAVDLNSDMGEGFGPWQMGDDEAMLSIVSSANIACGWHAGDPLIMHRTAEIAKAKGVSIGAHPASVTCGASAAASFAATA